MTYFTEYLEKCEDSDILDIVVIANATNMTNWKFIEYEDDMSGGFAVDIDRPIKVSTFEKYYKKGSAW